MFLNFLGRVLRRRKNKYPVPSQAVVLDEGVHHFQIQQFDRHAVSILKELDYQGYDACLVGGCLRDLFLGLEAKDCDVVTDAKPEKIKKMFKRSLLVGRRFKLAHVRFGRHVIEVATYRGKEGHKQTTHSSGRVIQDNVYGSLESDVWRRDFTINALYFRYRDRTVIDRFGGLDDLKKRTIKTIGDPEVRFQEDPVRMIRAVRFAAKLSFQIGDRECRAMQKLQKTILDVPEQRLFHELIKLFYTGHADASYTALKKYDFFSIIFPALAEHLSQNRKDEKMVLVALKQTDRRYRQGDSLSPAFLFAVFYWPLFQADYLTQLLKKKVTLGAFKREYARFTADLFTKGMLTKRHHEMIFEMYYLQVRMRQLTEQNTRSVLRFKKVRAAFDLLLLRQECEHDLGKSIDYWRMRIEKK